MCGIAALVQPDLKRELLGHIEPMTKIIEHRGPDGAGHIAFENIALGHRRLAIVDLTQQGRQPMNKGDLYLTYNGEIYNHVELRRELESYGYRFESTSDTEVVLAAYDRWGEECLHRLNGMWALVLYDRSKRQVFVARDRFGIKPLYLWPTPGGGLAIASEIKQFTVLPGWRAFLNRATVVDFLAHGIMDHSHETMFNGVIQLPAAHCITLQLDRMPSSISNTFKRWYEVPNSDFGGTYPEAVESLRNLFENSINLHLRADVDVGSCLSGGLDSSSIVCLASRLLKEQNANSNQKTFSACWNGYSVDESRYIETVATRTQAEASRVYPSADELFEILPKILWHMDEPFVSTSIFAQWKVFELAGKHVKVMLDGQGADEILLGYPGFQSVYLAEKLRRVRLGEFKSEAMLMCNNSNWRARDLLLQTTNDFLPRSLARVVKRSTGLGGRQHQILRSFGRPNPVFSNRRRKTVKQASLAELQYVNLPMLLHWEDRSSMAHGIEARVPYLDYRMVEFCLSLPDHFKLKDGFRKQVLRDAMAADVPVEVLARKDKIGFATPERDWFQGPLRETILSGCQQAISRHQDLFQTNAGEALNWQLQANPILPWRIFCFNQWTETFNVQG